jgi:thiol-disulfide isomerase/thioredoxin
LYNVLMNKKILVLIVVILLAIGGGITYLLTSSSDKSAKQEMVSQNTTPTSPSPSSTQQTSNSQPGAYIDYSQSVIAETTGTKLLFFHASWCPQCTALEADIKSRGVPAGVSIIKVDYDSNQSLRQKYGVTLQTTVVRIDDQGNLVKKFVAYDDPSLSAIKENLL